MDMTIDSHTSETPVAAGYDPRGAAAVPELAPGILSGEGVHVAEATDFERMLERLRFEQEEKKRELNALQFASALLTLAGRYENLTASQKAAAQAVADATLAESAAAGACRKAEWQLGVDTIALEVLTKKLEALVKAQTKTPEEREKELREKETREETVAAELAEKEDHSAEIAELERQIAALKPIVEQDRVAYAAAQTALDRAQSGLAAAVGRLDAVMLQVVAESVRQAAQNLAAAAAEQPDGAPREKRANAIVAAMGEYVEALQEMRDEELAEIVAKISDDIAFLAQAKYTVAPEELLPYEARV